MLLFSAYSSDNGTSNDESGDPESIGEESNDHV